MELWKLGWQGNQRQTEDSNNSSRKEPATSNGTSYFHSPRSEILSTLSDRQQLNFTLFFVQLRVAHSLYTEQGGCMSQLTVLWFNLFSYVVMVKI